MEQDPRFASVHARISNWQRVRCREQIEDAARIELGRSSFAMELAQLGLAVGRGEAMPAAATDLFGEVRLMVPTEWTPRNGTG